VKLQPGETLIVMAKDCVLTADIYPLIVEDFKAAFPQNKVIVLDFLAEFTVITDTQSGGKND
jgi:hypothetical protein